MELPWNDETVCVIASGTKGICATAIMMLVERGLLDLEAPIERVWPEFAEGGKGQVTVGDSLAHVAGVPGLGAFNQCGRDFRSNFDGSVCCGTTPDNPNRCSVVSRHDVWMDCE